MNITPIPQSTGKFQTELCAPLSTIYTKSIIFQLDVSFIYLGLKVIYFTDHHCIVSEPKQSQIPELLACCIFDCFDNSFEHIEFFELIRQIPTEILIVI